MAALHAGGNKRTPRRPGDQPQPLGRRRPGARRRRARRWSATRRRWPRASRNTPRWAWRHFIFSGYPHLEEAYRFAELVFPLLPRKLRDKLPGRVGDRAVWRSRGEQLRAARFAKLRRDDNKHLNWPNAGMDCGSSPTLQPPGLTAAGPVIAGLTPQCHGCARQRIASCPGSSPSPSSPSGKSPRRSVGSPPACCRRRLEVVKAAWTLAVSGELWTHVR